MSYSAKLSLLKNLYKCLFNLKKKNENFNFEAPPEISFKEKLSYTKKDLEHFARLVNWNSAEIPPTFPYALLTHLQFSIVNDKNFPFPPFGIIHKKEILELLKPLKNGEWQMYCHVNRFNQVDRGIEIEIISELFIDGELSWKSTTMAFKKLKSGASKSRQDKLEMNNPIHWHIPANQGLLYGLISNNIDPIHISKITAKMMGHKSSIIHGMWTLARGLSEFKDVRLGDEIHVKFIAPIYLPADVFYNHDETGFGVFSQDGRKTHLIVEIKR